jgi:hypothetical protein
MIDWTGYQVEIRWIARPHARIVTLGSHRIASTASVSADYECFARISSLFFLTIRIASNKLNEMSTTYPLRMKRMKRMKRTQTFKLDSNDSIRGTADSCRIDGREDRLCCGQKTHHLSSSSIISQCFIGLTDDGMLTYCQFVKERRQTLISYM